MNRKIIMSSTVNNFEVFLLNIGKISVLCRVFSMGLCIFTMLFRCYVIQQLDRNDPVSNEIFTIRSDQLFQLAIMLKLDESC